MLISNEGMIHSKEEELRLLLVIICEIHLELNKNRKNSNPKNKKARKKYENLKPYFILNSESKSFKVRGDDTTPSAEFWAGPQSPQLRAIKPNLWDLTHSLQVFSHIAKFWEDERQILLLSYTNPGA